MRLIRAATEEDAGLISHVHVESWRSTYKGIVPDQYLAELDEAAGAVRWREAIASDVRIFVAVEDDEVVGFAAAGAIREPLDGYDAELGAIYLLERVQRRGIGDALLRAIAGSLGAGGFKSMVVWVLESNASSHFYERLGGVRIASKEIEIGGLSLPAVAYGWTDLLTIGTSK
jgi:L-amino acid N-acyltransferase YncA